MSATQTTVPKRTRRDPSVIRVGDRVRILRDQPVQRVGYPKVVQDYYEAVESLSGTDLDFLFAKYCSIKLASKREGMRRLFVHNLAYLLARKDGFGGSARQLFMGKSVDKIGCFGVVKSIRFVKTGEYFGPSFCRNSYEWEPGGLAKEQTHKICTVEVGTELGIISSFHYGPHDFLATDLEKQPP